jgi:Sulfotransferase family
LRRLLDHMDDRTRVLFIGGYTRSGSTLLERVLGRADGYFASGEIRHLWREGLKENRRCGCGDPFRECKFWREVFRDAYGSMDALDVDEVLQIKESVDRFWRIPQIRWRTITPPHMRTHLTAYRSLLGRLYESIGRVSGARVIIDSTKDSSHGHLLSTMASLDLDVVHLVRDSRAVAYSWQRMKYNPGSGREMDRYGLLRTALGWDATNSLVGWLRVHAHTYTRLRYEDFVADPASATEEIYGAVGRFGHTPALDGGRVELTPDHTVAGNPIRFTQGAIEIRNDEEWRRAMGDGSRALVAATSWPVLKAYGFE